jgi:SpoIID/LytB domain
MIKLKKVMILSIIFVLTLLLLPAASLALFDRDEKPVAKLVSQSCLSFGSEGSHSVTVTVPETGERETMSETEYLCGVVASQMPPDYDDEAIKAQAVASYSVLKYRKLHGETEAQSFITKKQMKQKWGKDYAGNYSRIKELVGQVNGEYLAYKGKPILAAYHEISSGVTERGENIWEGKFPYLVPVDSRDDICAENYRSTVRLSGNEFSAVCRDNLGISSDKAARDWLGECVRSDSGYVMRYCLCGEKFTGQRIRNAFGLRSACFTLKYEGGEFVFDVKGSGHGAGMSKFGANLMALSGKNYREILAHYYQGTQLKAE